MPIFLVGIKHCGMSGMIRATIVVVRWLPLHTGVIACMCSMMMCMRTVFFYLPTAGNHTECRGKCTNLSVWIDSVELYWLSCMAITKLYHWVIKKSKLLEKIVATTKYLKEKYYDYRNLNSWSGIYQFIWNTGTLISSNIY